MATKQITKGPPMAVTVRGAWRTYLRETKPCLYPHYYEVEPWAWQRLQQNLKQLKQPMA
jgi:hypothetical protein